MLISIYHITISCQAKKRIKSSLVPIYSYMNDNTSNKDNTNKLPTSEVWDDSTLIWDDNELCFPDDREKPTKDEE